MVDGLLRDARADFAGMPQGAIVILQSAGIDLTSLNVLVGAIGVGLGFGLQNISSNFFSGLILLFERPIRVGDVVTIGDKTGVRIEADVVAIGPRFRVRAEPFASLGLRTAEHPSGLGDLGFGVGVAARAAPGFIQHS